MAVPKDLEGTYSRIMMEATKIANRDIRNAFGKRHWMGLGWSPFRPNLKGKTGLGFTMSQVDAYQLREYSDLVSQITTNAVQQAIVKYRKPFFTFMISDVLLTDQTESFYDPPKYDPSVKRFRNTLGRFSKKNKWL